MSIRAARSRRRASVNDQIRRANALLDQLGLPARFTLDDLVGAVEVHIGRKIRLYPQTMPAGAPAAALVSGRYEDYVFYDTSYGHVYQRQIIGHEIGHLLFHHLGEADDERPSFAQMAPDSDLTGSRALVIGSVIAGSFVAGARDHRDGDRDAEVFGTVVAVRSTEWGDTPPPAGVDPAIQHRLSAVLEPRAVA